MKSFRTLAALAVLASAVTAGAFGPNSQSATLSVVNANSTTGACTSGSCVNMVISTPSGTIFTSTLAQLGTVGFQITGTWSGTIEFDYSMDEGATWVAALVNPVPTTSGIAPAQVTTTTANGKWTLSTAGYTTVRAVSTTFTSGAPVVVLEGYTSITDIDLASLPAGATDPNGKLVLGRSQSASYNFTALHALGASVGALATVEADGTNRLYVKQITVCRDLAAVQTTAAPRTIVVYATTAASASGSTATPNPLDSASAAAGNVARLGALTTTPAIASVAEAQAIDEFSIMIPATAPALLTDPCITRKYDGTGGLQPLAVAKTVGKGIAVADNTGTAGGGSAGNFIVSIVFTNEST